MLGILLSTILDADLDRLRDPNETRGHQAGDGTIGHAPCIISAGFPGAVEVSDTAMYAEKQRRSTTRSMTVSPERVVGGCLARLQLILEALPLAPTR